MREREPAPPGRDPGWHAWISRAEFVLLNAVLIASLGIVLLQVVSRSVFDHPLSWTDEASRLALVWLTFLGAGYLMSQGKHLSVDSFASLFPPRARMVIEVVSNTVVALACASVLVAGIGFVGVVKDSVSTALSVSMAWFYGPALAGTALVTLHAVVNSVLALRRGGPIYPGIADEAADQHLDQDRTGPQGSSSEDPTEGRS